MSRPNPVNLKELFSYRLNRLAHVSSRIASTVNESQFGLGPRDWRIIGLLGAFAPLSLNELAHEANLDKSQASRSVSDLIERGYVNRGTDATDGRGIQLSLTTKGKNLYRKVFPNSVERNEALLAVLTPDEREVLESVLDKLTGHSISMLTALRDEPGKPKRKSRA